MDNKDKENAIEVIDLTKRFGKFTAVDKLNFRVKRGEVFGFLGPNGAGKSTTIRMLCGVLEPTEGTGTVDGYDITKSQEEIKKRIGYMSQQFSLYEDLTIAENIDFYGGIYGLKSDELKKRKEYLFEVTGLKGREKSLAGELSGGWKQRLAVGCAILHQPKILFLDEPTSGVDPISRRNFWELIYHVASEGTTVLVTTHYMDEAEQCDRLGLIYRGKLIALGEPNELKAEYHEELLEVECKPLMEGLEVLSDIPIVKEVALFGALLHVTVSDAQKAIPKIESELEQKDIHTVRVDKIEPTLEDVFVSLIEKQSSAS